MRPTDLRQRTDRRRHGWRTMLSALHRRRRAGPRRDEDRHRPHYLDIYQDARILLWATGIIAFCALDAFLTLQIIDRGGVEINPVMAFLLGISIPAFFYTKYLITAGAIVFIVMHINFRIRGFPVRLILPVFFYFYLGLIGYEWMLLFT